MQQVMWLKFLWLMQRAEFARSPGEERRCSPEYSFTYSIFIFTRKKMLQELSETVNHKYLKIIFQDHLKWTCSILQDYKRKKKDNFFPFSPIFKSLTGQILFCCLFIFTFFFFFPVTTANGHLTCFKKYVLSVLKWAWVFM